MLRKPPPVALTGDPDERNYKSDKFVLGTLTNITVCWDPICPWCYVGYFHARRLTEQFGVTFDWRGFELIPPGMVFTPPPPKPVDPDAPPKPPSRFDLFAAAEGLPLPSPRPAFASSHNALLGAEYVLSLGDSARFDAYIESVCRGYWEKCDDISNLAVLVGYATALGMDAAAFSASVKAAEFLNHIVPYDDDAYAAGIRHVPTFLFNAEEKLAEAEYTALAHATERFLVRIERFKEKSH